MTNPVKVPATTRPPAGLRRGRRRRFLVLALALGAGLLLGVRAPTLARAAPVWPITGPVISGFDPPAARWLAGHRGIDLAGEAGEPVRAAASGTVTWVGTIAGVPMVSVDLPDGRRHTYQPVDPGLLVGSSVAAGDQIGRLTDALARSGHCPMVCLHWGLKRDEAYFDPRSAAPVRLLPRGTAPPPVGDRVASPPAGTSRPAARGRSPAAGPVTSPFGMRVHPVTGVYKLHDGIDIGAACGTPVTVPWAGVVIESGPRLAWGNRVVLDHGLVDGRHLVSTYNHLSSSGWWPIGASLAAGRTVGTVGSTGYSTGCHLHFSTLVGGAPVDPVPLLVR